MKKILVGIFAFCAVTISAATMRHFNIDVDNIPVEQVTEHFWEWFTLPNSTTFAQSNMMSDDEGYVHYCYNQYINGIIVEGGQILVHSTNGIVQYVNGVILETEETVSPVTNKISKKSSSTYGNPEILIVPIENETDFRYAYKYVSEELGADVYVDVENGDTLKLSSFYSNVQTIITTNTIYSGRQKLTVEKGGTQCKYSVTSPRIETINSTNVYFRAGDEGWNNFYTNQIQNAKAYTETEADSLNSYLTAITYHRMETDWCYDLEEGETYPDFYIKIYNSSNVLVYQSQVYKDWKDYISFNPMLRLDGDTYTVKLYDEDFLNDDYAGYFTISSQTKGIGSLSRANFDVTVEVAGNPIRDVHWGMEKTLAFYKNVLNRNSYDGNGATVYQFVNPFHPGKTPNNSSARIIAPYCMYYGLGDGLKYHPIVALDVMAHEFTHMVTAHNIVGGFDSSGESQALNEGFSDIFAVLTEGYTYGQYDWTIGEKYEMEHLYTRSFIYPKSGNPAQPTTYGKDPWDTKGEAHINSSILTHWFYLLCNGGSGTNDNQQAYSVQSIEIPKATKIAYNTLMTGLTKTASFADARESTIKETIKLYGKGSQEHQSVVNAWYAVGVGDKYKEVVCKSVPYTETFASSQGDFTIQNVTLPSGFTYIWNWSSQYGMVASCIKNSTKYASESWLISPCIEIPSTDKCVLTFSHAAKFFQNTSQMTLWVSSDYYEGVPSSATWQQLTIPTYPTGQNWNWFESGEIDLSAYKGQKISLAFKYTSSTSYAPQWEIKNFAVKKVSTQDVEAVKPSHQQATKILRNGQIFIIRGEKTYTMTGQEVR